MPRILDTSASLVVVCEMDFDRRERDLRSFHETAARARGVSLKQILAESAAASGASPPSASSAPASPAAPPPAAPSGPLITLHVYDVTDFGVGYDISRQVIAFNRGLFSSFEVGIFHAGVAVCYSGFETVEYSFGWCDAGTGVYTCAPRRAPGASFRCAIDCGRTPLTRRQVAAAIARMAREWDGASYALLHRNCCSFCDALCDRLRVRRPPAWVNGLADAFAPVGAPSDYVTGKLDALHTRVFGAGPSFRTRCGA